MILHQNKNIVNPLRGYYLLGADYSGIASFFANTIMPSSSFDSPYPVNDTSLLYPDFKNKVDAAIACFNQRYPDIPVVYVETYRSNTLQEQYYNAGSSQIQDNGMHHYGLAADLAFNINGAISYNGDYTFLRQCLSDQGLTLLGSWDIGHVQYIPVSEQTAMRDAVSSFDQYTSSNNGSGDTSAPEDPGPSSAGISPLVLIFILGAGLYLFSN